MTAAFFLDCRARRIRIGNYARIASFEGHLFSLRQLRDIVGREFRGGGHETHLPAVRKADRRSEDFVKRTRTKSLQDPRRRKVDDLLRRLKKNESWRTEITGYISQLNIQLHRWQLRLQTLNERKKELAAEIDGIQKVVQ
jgi:hypothetical protein